MIISAFYSGLRGGRMFADGLIALLDDHGLMEKVPFIAQPFKADESYVDEAVPRSTASHHLRPCMHPRAHASRALHVRCYNVHAQVLYTMAAAGFSFQFFSGFKLPFPLNIIFLPLNIIEWFLRIQISMGQTLPIKN